jgi:hypothetical protein
MASILTQERAAFTAAIKRKKFGSKSSTSQNSRTEATINRAICQSQYCVRKEMRGYG